MDNLPGHIRLNRAVRFRTAGSIDNDSRGLDRFDPVGSFHFGSIVTSQNVVAAIPFTPTISLS